MQGFPDTAVITGAEKLGDQHRGTAAQTNEKTVQQADQRTGGTYGSQCLGTHKPAHNDGIHSVIHLLEESAQQNGEEKGKQLFPDDTLGNVNRFLRHNPASLLRQFS